MNLPATTIKANPVVEQPWYENFTWVSLAIGSAALFFLIAHWLIEQYTPAIYGESMLNFILKEAGMAGLIAVFLNVSIEWINRRRHAMHQQSLLEELEKKHAETTKKLLVEVNAQLFKTVYQRNIDSAVFQQVEKHLLRSDVMRRQFEVSFVLERFLEPNTFKPTEFVMLKYRNDYHVVNLTDKPVVVDVVKAMVDVTPSYKESCKFTRVVLGNETVSDEELRKSVTNHDHRNLMTVKINRSVPANDTLRVSVEYCKLAPLDYYEIVCSTVPMDGLALEVITPDQLFTVEAISLHPEDEVVKVAGKLQSKWCIEHAILPGQGIAMMWHLTDKTLQKDAAQST
jgi:hypothetical protein